MSEKVGLHQQDALAQGGRRLAEAGQGLGQDVNRMLDEMERDVSAIQGSALGAFRQARGQLTEAMSGLVRWCSDYSGRLDEGQAGVNQTDASLDQDFHSAGSGFEALANMNHPR